MELDYGRLKTVSLRERRHIVEVSRFGTPRCGTVAEFVQTLPDILGGRSLQQLLAALKDARTNQKSRIWAMGAHVIKCGVAPYLIRLMENGFVSHIALNGAGIIHDFEIALVGATSEDVAESIRDGSFGMARETSEELSEILTGERASTSGIGTALGEVLEDPRFPHRDQSLIARARDLGVTVSVHPALGTDVLHYHAGFDWEKVGRASRVDFDQFVHKVAGLDGGGIHLNVGSAVLLPELFLKAVSIVRNLGHSLEGFTTAVLDMIDHYRPRENVIRRPGGKGIQLIGQHEILIPLIACSLDG